MRAEQNVVFLSPRSGGGHDGTARAVAAWMERAGTRAECAIIDVYGSGLRVLPWMATIRQHGCITRDALGKCARSNDRNAGHPE